MLINNVNNCVRIVLISVLSLIHYISKCMQNKKQSQHLILIFKKKNDLFKLINLIE